MPFQPPANLKDFDRSRFSDQLYQIWDEKIAADVNARITNFPAFFNPLNPPSTVDSDPATPEWTGLPRTLKRRLQGNIVRAAELIDNPIDMGSIDPVSNGQKTSQFVDIQNSQPYLGPQYRPQDEYLEWITRRDVEGNITEVIFTAEGPEYWNYISFDPDLLVALYRDLVSPNVRVEDLYFDRSVAYWNGNQGGAVCYNPGDYNPYNIWNMRGAVHLTEPANTLGAEINLAKGATRLYGDSELVTQDPDLITCGGYGGINRMSDPTIGFAVNNAVQNGSRVSLRNPIGLYIKGISPRAFALDGTPILNIDDYFVPIRPRRSDVTDMIVRARFRVPNGVTIDGRQAYVSDLTVDGEAIRFGGQIADKIILRLFALTASGAPQQDLVPCVSKACNDPNNPDLIIPVEPGMDCPTADAVAADIEPLFVTAMRRGRMAMANLSLTNR